MCRALEFMKHTLSHTNRISAAIVKPHFPGEKTEGRGGHVIRPRSDNLWELHLELRLPGYKLRALSFTSGYHRCFPIFLEKNAFQIAHLV